MDEYWVASSFVQLRPNKALASRFAPPSTAIAAIALLLAFAASAHAESTPGTPGGIALPAPASSGSLSAEPAPTPAIPAESTPVSAPEAVEEVGTTATAVVESIGAAAENNPATPPPGEVAAPPVPAVPTAAPSLSAAVGQSKVELDTTVVTTVAGHVTQLTERIPGDSAKAIAPLVARVERFARTAVAHTPVLPPAPRLLSDMPVAKRLSGLASLLSGDPPSQTGRLQAPAGVTSPAPTHFSFPSGTHHFAEGPLAGVLARERTGRADPLVDRFLGFVGAEPTRAEMPSGQLGGVRAGSAAPSGNAPLNTSQERSNDRAPLGAPPRLPGSLGAATGSAGSSFVPFAALLALLALAAPAARRRLREAPAFPPPTPFVCGLECPG